MELKSNHKEETVSDDAKGHSSSKASDTIFVMDANPILADGIASILMQSQHLSSFKIRTRPISDYYNLKCKSSDILVFDPTQVLQGLTPAHGFFQDRAKIMSLIGYCPDISLDDLRVFNNSGFRAILPKSVPSEELLRSVCAVAFGGNYVHDSYKDDFAGATDVASDKIELTDRERAVLRNLALGVSMKQIAAILDISAKTVDTYKTRANRKLNLNTRADIVQFAIKSGWMN